MLVAKELLGINKQTNETIVVAAANNITTNENYSTLTDTYTPKQTYIHKFIRLLKSLCIKMQLS